MSSTDTTAARRTTFLYAGEDGKFVEVFTTGLFDQDLIDALEAYVARQKRRLSQRVTEPVESVHAE